ncbi:hypothetical protein [Leptothoe spongobia]|uniref:Uncharacterized protein n=1 Tax=Leptothoe spongobia TAU-MAC 1115 TaxID=1967444 RepID=A0A947GIE9_9CYAN|nr:hypothetical protein [Leptothoe spongobia]MBT9315669.1 hypothetical protein [Leptothoe spongobia TAU-MAC 1115]
MANLSKLISLDKLSDILDEGIQEKIGPMANDICLDSQQSCFMSLAKG